MAHQNRWETSSLMRSHALRNIGTVAGYANAVLQIVAFAWYGITIYSGATHTNPITWYLLFIETVVGLLIYANHTKDVPKYAGEIIALIGVVGMGIYLTTQTLWGTRLVWETVDWNTDLIPTVAAVGAFLYWFPRRNSKRHSRIALWLYQIAIFGAMGPLILSTWTHPTAEPFGPWAVWTVGFALQTICAAFRWEDKESLFNPINYAITHGIVAGIVWYSAASF
jgi:hypothetical protein